MAQQTVTGNYAGEVLDTIKAKLSTGNEVVSNGLANLIPEIRYKTFIPRIKLDNLIGARAATPSTSLGTSAFDDKEIAVADFMLYHEFNPRNFESWWRPYQPTGPLVFRELPTQVQTAFLMEIAKYAGKTVSDIILSGDTAGGTAPLNILDGFVKTLEGDADVIDVATPVALTTGNIQAKMEETYAASPVAVRRNMNYKILVSPATAEIYRNAVHAQTNKGNDFTQDAPLTYKGKQMVELVGMPDDTIVASHFSAGIDSNLHVAMDWDQDSLAMDESVLLVDRLANNSELYFVRGDFKLGVGVAFGEEVVLYKA